MAGGMLFCFTWLETERLHNEYRAIELTREIRRVKDDIDRLRGERHRLSRLDRMHQAAPRLQLVEPKPGQIEIVSIEGDSLRALLSTPVETPVRRTRSAYLNLESAPPRPANPDRDALAQSPAQDPANQGTRF